MKVGVTGSKGFIGMKLVKALKAKGHEVREMDIGTRYNLLDTGSLKNFVEGLDIIFHLGGVSLSRTSYSNLIKVNVLGTTNLLEAVKEHNLDAKFVLASSIQVYRPTEDPETALPESAPKFPPSMYGISKKFCEDLVKRYNEELGIRSIIYRMSNVYGAEARPYYNSVITTFLDLGLNNKPITIFGTGKQMRDFVHIDDVIDAYLLLLDKEFPDKTEAYNISTCEMVSLIQMVGMLEELLGKEYEKSYKEVSESFLYHRCDYSKAKGQLGWSPKLSFKDGLKKLFEEYDKDAWS